MLNKLLKTALATTAFILMLENPNIWYYWLMVCIYWLLNLYQQIEAEIRLRKKLEAKAKEILQKYKK